MNWNKEKIIRTAERILKRSYFYLDNRATGMKASDNCQIECALIKGSRAAPEDIIVYASNVDMAILVRPLDENAEVEAIWDWSFDLDNELFEKMERGYELVGMSLSCHSTVWEYISELHDGGIEYPLGVQKYLDYCKRNGITREFLQEECKYTEMDVMALYDKKTVEMKLVKAPKDHER